MANRVEQSADTWRAALAVVALATLARVAYLLWLCPYGLVEDEAYYWLWSRHLDWSYLTKGPGVALAVAAGTRLLGHTEAGVRLVAPLSAGILALLSAGLAGEIARGIHQPVQTPGSGDAHNASSPPNGPRLSRARLWGACAALLCPPLQASALLMTIDGPMLACWAGATWAGLRALHGRGTWAWVALGLALGAGILFKPIILAVAAGLLGHAIASRRSLDLSPRWWAWASAGLALTIAGFLPLLLWDADHSWAMLRHLESHLRSTADSGPEPGLGRRLGWVGEYVGLQIALGGFVLASGLLGVVWLLKLRGAPTARAGARACAWISGTVYAAYLAVALFTRVEGNWPMGGLVPMLGSAGVWLASRTPSRLRKHLTRTMVVVGVVAGLGMTRLDLLAKVPGVGHLSPVGRLVSGPTMADGVRHFLDRLDAERVDAAPTRLPAFVMADHYGRAAQMSFYLRDRRVACSSGLLGDGITQFDLWQSTRADDPALIGRSAILLSGRPEVWARVFDSVEEIDPIPGDHRARRAFIGRGYKLPPSAAPEPGP